MDTETAAVAGTGGEGAAQGADAFPHAEQPVPAAAARGVVLAAAVVHDGDLDVGSDLYDADLGLGLRPGVLLHVGEGLLDDPVGGQVDGRGEGGVVVGAGDLDVQAGVAEGAGEFVEAVQAGGGFGGGLRVT
ncbi:hypothetical protein SVIOM74S_08794 [Streptomyces violarus]